MNNSQRFEIEGHAKDFRALSGKALNLLQAQINAMSSHDELAEKRLKLIADKHELASVLTRIYNWNVEAKKEEQPA